jgi:hypothetical protein
MTVSVDVQVCAGAERSFQEEWATRLFCFGGSDGNGGDQVFSNK